MKIKTSTIEENQIGEFDEAESTISRENLGVAMSLVSENLYSNPIGSFIREITSNAIDANVEAGVDEPVLIEIFSRSGIYYISFTDQGLGMDKETFNSVYMSWFNSSKREDNSQIGGFGIGSKSPLSYQNSFEISTRVDGIEYNYMFINSKPVPKAPLISKEETDKPSGTTITIEIKEDDIYEVHKQCEKQLYYFTNVYVKNNLYFYDNDFIIHESKEFKLRESKYPFGSEMHISLGQVCYPINWKYLQIDPIKIPVGLKFEVGDLEVTLSREEINYNERTKEILLNKISVVDEYLVDLYEKQRQIEDLFDYINIIKSETKKLKIGKVEIEIKNSKKQPIFKALNLAFFKKHIDDVFCLYDTGTIKNGNATFSNNKSDDLLNNAFSFYLVKERLNFYDSLYINDGYIVKRRKLNKERIFKIARLLDLLKNKDKSHWSFEISDLKEGGLKTINDFIKILDKAIEDKTSVYEGTAPKTWVEEYKENQREKQEERKEFITFYDVYNKRTSKKIGDLLDNYKAIFYLDKKEEEEEKVNYTLLFRNLPRYFRDNLKLVIISPTTIKKLKKYDTVISVHKIFQLEELKHHFYRVKLSYIFKKELYLHSNLFSYSKYYYDMYRKLLNNYNINLQEKFYDVPYKSNNYTYTTNIDGNYYKYFQHHIDNIKLNKGYKSLKYEGFFPILINVRNKLKVLNYIGNFDYKQEKVQVPHNFYVDVFKQIKILKLKPEYYKYKL